MCNLSSHTRACVYIFLSAGMSGRNPYALNDGYATSNARGRYGDLYAPDNNSSTSSVNGYGTRGRRAEGYGGLGPEPNEESPQPPTSRTGYGVEQDVGYRRKTARNNRDQEYSDSSRSRDRAAPRTNGVSAYSSRRGQRSMEGESPSLTLLDASIKH